MADPADESTDHRYREVQEASGKLRLITELDSETIKVRLEPVQPSPYTVPIRSIERVVSKTFSASMDTGFQWGTHVEKISGDVAFRVTGENGVELRLDDGNRVYIGSDRPRELAAAINSVLEEGPDT